MEPRDHGTQPKDLVTDRLQMLADPKLLSPRSAAAQRRAMQAAMASAVRAMRSPERRRAGWRQPPGGLL
jgi:hypothetical protein